MIPKLGDTVILAFRVGVQLEGQVIEWSDQKSVLKSLTGASTIVIQKTAEDILFYKIQNSKTEHKDLIDKPIKDLKDIETIAALKNDLNELERAEIREKLSSHSVGEVKQVSYVIPSNIKVKSIEHHTEQKTTREDFGFGKELQDLFSKKH